MNALGYLVGSVALSAVGTLLAASRQEAMDAPFVAVPSDERCPGRRWDCPRPARTRQYEVLRLPKAPVFHPYNLYGYNERAGKDAVQVSMNFHFSKDFFEALPPALAARIRAQGLGRDQVDVFWEVQDQPWSGTPLLLRPHYWCDPEAPSRGHRNLNFPIQVGLFEAPAGVQFAGHGADAFFQSAIQVHGPEEGEGTILSSPNNLAVAGLDPGTTWTFWTLTQTGQRAAATLHVLLKDADQAEFDGLALREGTLRKLVGALDQSESLRGTPMVAQLKRLTRPLISGRELLPAVQGQAPKLVIRGSGFTGATAVTVGGEPGSHLQVLDDRTVTLNVLEGVKHSEDLVIVTPMGVSQAPGPAVVAAPVQLWQRGAGHDLVVPAAGGTVGVYQTQPCAPGEVFEGTCFASTEGMTRGLAQINMQFTGPGLAASYGTAPAPGPALSTRVPERVPLAVRGTAPAGATQVQFYLQEFGCNPGARATFGQVMFVKRVAP